ncbi:MAG: phosphopantothenoylcysteine decarboxylase, partial [Candidatus Amulumruptor caecigallinarius]|nr:phosphopantothenoylcysteine decarboxylase [Candidatus Amulumruptor caecigallinarius]
YPSHESFSAKMGFALAEECASRGAEVTLVAGPVALEIADTAVKRINVESAVEMRDKALAECADADIAIFAAAVADYAPATVAAEKIKREKSERMTLELVKNPDIAAECAAHRKPGQCFVGFALETGDEMQNAGQKLAKKNLDLIVLNSLRDKGAGFRTDTNKVTIISSEYTKEFPLKSKKEVATDILDEIMSCRKTDVTNEM